MGRNFTRRWKEKLYLFTSYITKQALNVKTGYCHIWCLNETNCIWNETSFLISSACMHHNLLVTTINYSSKRRRRQNTTLISNGRMNEISFVYNLKHAFNNVINISVQQPACFSPNQGISGAPFVYKKTANLHILVNAFYKMYIF